MDYIVNVILLCVKVGLYYTVPCGILKCLDLSSMFNLNSMHYFNVMSATVNVVYRVILVLKRIILRAIYLSMLSIHTPRTRIQREIGFLEEILGVRTLCC